MSGEGMGTASRTVGLLGAIFTYAVRHRMRTDNPVHGIMRPADGRRDRRQSDDEYKALGKALRKAEANMWPAAIALTRFLILTGWRSGEAVGLRWNEIDLPRRTALLGDTKTGRSMRPLSRAACAILKQMTRSGDFVFSPARGERGIPAADEHRGVPLPRRPLRSRTWARAQTQGPVVARGST